MLYIGLQYICSQYKGTQARRSATDATAVRLAKPYVPVILNQPVRVIESTAPVNQLINQQSAIPSIAHTPAAPPIAEPTNTITTIERSNRVALTTTTRIHI
jgi:hypothetical protein